MAIAVQAVQGAPQRVAADVPEPPEFAGAHAEPAAGRFHARAGVVLLHPVADWFGRVDAVAGLIDVLPRVTHVDLC